MFEQTFGTQLEEKKLDPKLDYAFQSFYYPRQGVPWSMPPELAEVIDDAYIQWPHIYMASRKPAARRARRRGGAASPALAKTTAGAAAPGVSAGPPRVNYYHLELDAMAGLLNVAQVHQQGTTGKGVRVVMVDTGFDHRHPYFVSKGYNTSVDLAPHATNDLTDLNGHGSGESANLLAVAPGITFIGIKVENDSDPRNGASMLEGFQQALLHNPQIISLSMGYDLRAGDGTQLSELPNNMAALEAEIQAAVAKGIIVVFSAGNGHFSFPGMMPDVISAGGVFVDGQGRMQASDYASAFHSKIYAGRSGRICAAWSECSRTPATSCCPSRRGARSTMRPLGKAMAPPPPTDGVSSAARRLRPRSSLAFARCCWRRVQGSRHRRSNRSCAARRAG